MKKRFTGAAAFVLSASLLLSTACSKKDSKKKSDSDLNEDIVEVVEDYFKNLSDMSFKKVKKSVEDSAFGDLDLKSDEFDVLSAYLEKVEIEVTEADGKEKKGTGSATVSVTYVDLKTIVKDLDDSDDAEEYIDAINAKKAKTKEEEIELDMVYDDEWKIEDDTPVYDLLMDEFDTICENISGGAPVETDPTTMSTTEATTVPTTTEDTTTTTTTEATSEDSSTTGIQSPTGMQTLPSPGITDRHIKVGQDFLDTCGNHGFTYELSQGNEYDTYLLSLPADDMALIYCEFKDAATCDKYAEQLINQVVYTNMHMDKGETVSDEWDGNTHHIYSQNNSAYNGHSIDMFIYRDDTIMVFVAIDQFPQADVSIEYYELLDELGVWKL